MKGKKLIFNLIALIIMALGCFAFNYATPVFALIFNKQSSPVSISSSGTYYLYSNNNGASGPDDFFTLDADVKSYNQSSKTEILYRSTGLCSTAAKCNGDYYTVLKMSDNLYRLAQAGLVNVTAYANFCSPTNSKKDKPETITMSLRSASSVDEGDLKLKNITFGKFSKSVKNCQTSYASSDYSATLNGVTDRYLVLRFSSQYSQTGTAVTSFNYMNVLKPRIVISYKKLPVTFNYGLSTQNVTYNSKISVNIPEKEGYEIYKVFANNQEIEFANNSFSLVVTEQTDVQFVYRKILNLSFVSNYSYDDGNSIDLAYTVNGGTCVPKFEYYQNNKKVDNISNIGTYLVKYSYANDEYILSGETSITVNPVECEISVEDKNFVYDGNAKELIAKNNKNAKMKIVIKDSNGKECLPINAGTYSYIISVDQYGYVGSISGSFSISKQEVDIQIPSNLKVEYSTLIQYLNFESNYNCIVSYEQNSVSVVPQNAGIYECKICVHELNYSGSISFAYEIYPREVEFSVVNASSIYGDPFSSVVYTEKNATDEIPDLSLKYNIQNKVGLYEIEFVELEENPNYIFKYSNGLYEVKPRKVSVVPSSNLKKMYGESDPDITFVASGLINKDTLEGKLSREIGEQAGNYAIQIGSLNNPNYEIDLQTEYFEIIPLQLVVKAKSYTKVYGEADPKVFEYSVLTQNINFELSGALERDEGEDVGNYAIKIGSLSNPNLSIVLVQGKLEILPKEAKIYAQECSKYFGDVDNLNYLTEGILPGDLLSGNLAREYGENVGEYKITKGTLNNPNYNLTFVPNFMKILPKEVKIEAIGSSKTYGDADPEFEFVSSISKSELSGKLSRQKGEKVGSYEINLGSIYNENYSINFTSAIFEITPRELLVICGDNSKTYGNPDPELKYTLDGIINNDQVSVELGREEGENCGEYDVFIASCSNSNYLPIITENSALHINKANFKINVENIETFYSGEEIVPEINFDGSFKIFYSLNGKIVDKVVDAGEYEYYIEFAGDNNYYPYISSNATIVVKKLMLPLTITYTSFIFDGEVHEPQYILDEDISVSVEFGDLSPSEIGSHKFKIIPSNPNYENIEGEINILPDVIFDQSDVSMQLVGGNVSTSSKDNIKFAITNISSAEFSRRLNVSNRKIVKAFETRFNNSVDSSKFLVEINLEEIQGKDIKIYAINSNNNLIEIEYIIEEDALSFQTNNANLTYVITVFEKSYLSAYQIVILVGIVVFSFYLYFVTKKFNKKAKKRKQSKKHHSN